MHIYNNFMHSFTRMMPMETLIAHHTDLCINVDTKPESITLQAKKHTEELIAKHKVLQATLVQACETQKKYYN